MKPLPKYIQESLPFQSFLDDMAALDARLVDRGGRPFAVIQARSNQRWWLLPLDRRCATAAGLEMLQPVTSVARLAKEVARLLARFGPPWMLGRGHIGLSDLTQLTDIQSAFGSRAAYVACFTGTEGPHRKTALQVMDADGRILGYAKLSRADHIRPYLRNEADTLRRVAAMGLKSADVPTILGFRDSAAVTILVTDSLKSASGAAPLVLGTNHFAFLSELSARSQTMGAEALLNKLMAEAAALGDLAGREWLMKFAQIDTVLRPLANDMPLCLTHGDFTPWNTFVLQGRLYVFDWEYSRAAWPVGFDLVHFVLSTTAPEVQPDRLPQLIQTLANVHFGQDVVMAARSLLLSLACHSLFYLGRLEEAGRPLSDWADGPARSAMIDKLLVQVGAP